MENNCAVEAIKLALETDEGLQFLRLWTYGEFDDIRKEWPECPESVFVGAEVGKGGHVKCSANLSDVSLSLDRIEAKVENVIMNQYLLLNR